MTKSPSRLASALALSLLLAACGSKINQENYNRITDDMAYAEVVQILGEPTSAESRGALGITAGTSKWKDNSHQITIVFINEKVSSKTFRDAQEAPAK